MSTSRLPSSRISGTLTVNDRRGVASSWCMPSSSSRCRAASAELQSVRTPTRSDLRCSRREPSGLSTGRRGACPDRARTPGPMALAPESGHQRELRDSRLRRLTGVARLAGARSGARERAARSGRDRRVRHRPFVTARCRATPLCTLTCTTTRGSPTGEAIRGRPSSRCAPPGLDAAAITDHTNLPSPWGDTLDEKGWRQLAELAAAADDPGRVRRDPRLRVVASPARPHQRLGQPDLDCARAADRPATSTASTTGWSPRRARRGADVLQPPRLARHRAAIRRLRAARRRSRRGWSGWRCSTRPTTTCSAFEHDGVSPLMQCLDAGWSPGPDRRHR